MSKRTPEVASEERVTAKSMSMMNLVSRCRVRDPIVLASIAPESLGTLNLLVKCAANKYGETCEGVKSGETRRWQVCHRWWYGLWHRHRWIIDFERYWTVVQKMQCKTSTKVLWFWWIFLSSTLEASVFMGKNFSENILQKYRERYHVEADVRHSWKVDSRTIRWFL